MNNNDHNLNQNASAAKEIESNTVDTQAYVDRSTSELEAAALNAPENEARTLSPALQVLKRFFRSKLSIAGLVILFVLFTFSFIGPLLSPWGESETDTSRGRITQSIQSISYVAEDGERYEVVIVTYTQALENVLAFPSADHWLGTDKSGYDVLTRLMYGGRVSLTLGFAVVFLEMLVGVLLGSLAGYFGKWVDQLIMRVVDVFNCVPTLPIMLIASAVISAHSDKIPIEQRIYLLMIVLTVFGWAGIARLVRGQILSLREQEFMVAAEALGLPTWRRIFAHLVPNILPQLIVIMTLSLGGIILTEATLSFLNLGVPHPQAAWGSMINAANDHAILEQYFHVWVPPGICIVLAVLGFNFVGDGLRDAFDPKSKR